MCFPVMNIGFSSYQLSVLSYRRAGGAKAHALLISHPAALKPTPY
jgi:hypothetical protein